MALRAFSCNPSLGGFGSENVAASGRDPTGDVTTSSIQSAQGHGALGDCGGGGDAFAQILKELVDNAVDACCSRTSDDDGANGMKRRSTNLKRVRVVIEPVVASSNRAEDDTDGASSAAPNGPKKELLRVSVNDNGVGMGSIEDCVEAFRTSKRSNGNAASGNTQSSTSTGSMGGSNPAGGGSASQDDIESQPRPLGESRTVGRYGIGLTLCLLHSQRLCPNSVASITSATAEAIQWTRASYVVDTEGDRVRCVEKEMLHKKRAGESGTMVSLLVPGGPDAATVWPRLAEYFARFQLSDMSCSLEVKAPTLSTVPLYIRPTFETERRQMKLEEMKRREQIREDESPSDKNNVITAELSQGTEVSRDNVDDRKVGGLDVVESDEDEWDDGLTVDDVASERRYESSQEAKRACTAEESDNSEKQIDQIIDQSQSSLASCKKSGSTDDEVDGRKNKQGPAEEDRPEENRRKFVQSAASSYLNRQIELRNVAHSVNPIRRGEESAANAATDRPMLGVDMVVYGRALPGDDRANSDGEESAVSSNTGDEFDAILYGNKHTDESGEVGKLILIRMVNRIPLLDGAEASSCGLVRGISKKKSTWNSYGLEVSPLIEDRVPCVISDGNAAIQSETDACIPKYNLKDSAQVAPFFRSNTHALYESDSDDNGESDSDEEEGSDDSYKFPGNEEQANPRNKRKRKKLTKLLPAGIRIGNVLVIAHIQANPSSLPLPTLSKGRVPMNDADIDDALEIGLSSCLRSLQRSNPELLLTANQLKRTERDVRYLPAIAASLASIIKNSSNPEFRSDVYGKVMSWRQERAQDDAEQYDADENSSTTSKSSIGPGQSIHEKMDRLSAIRLTGIIEEQLRYCISDENKQRKKEEERERKLDARRKEKVRKEKAKQKQKQSNKSKALGKKKNAKICIGDVSDESDSNIDLNALLLEGESEGMDYSQNSDDSSVLERRRRAGRIRDLAFIGSEDEQSTSSNSTKSAKQGQGRNERNESDVSIMSEEETDGDQDAEESDFSEDESILCPSEDVPQMVEDDRNCSRMRCEEVEEKKDDDDFGDGFTDDENGDDNDEWL